MVYTEVTFIATVRNVAALKCLQHRTARLIDVTTIVEAAIVHQAAHFREEVPELLLLDIDNAELPDTGRVYQPPAERQHDHFRKSGGMTPFVRPIRNIARAQRRPGVKRVDKR